MSKRYFPCITQKQFLMKTMRACLTVSLFVLPACNSTGANVNAAGSSIDTEAQKAADRYAAVEFIKCGDSSYATDGGQVWQLRNLKVVARPEDPERAADHKESRARRGINWYGTIAFECPSSRIYSWGQWMEWPRHCNFGSVVLRHERGVWLYYGGTTLEEWQERNKNIKHLTCSNIPR